MAAAVKKAPGGGGLLKNKKAIVALAALAVIVLYYLRSRSSSSTSTTATTGASTIDPATGLTYAQEQAAGLASQGGGTISGGSSSNGATSSDQLPVSASDPTSVAAALEGLASGLTIVQTQQANDEAQAQSAKDAAALTAEAYSQLNTLAGSVAGSLGTLGGYVTTTPAPAKADNKQAPVPPAPAAPPKPAKAPAASPIPAATLAATAAVNAARDKASVAKMKRLG